MPTRIDIAGQRFGMLVAVNYSRTVDCRAQWIFRCDCGITIEKASASVKAGLIKSCGCLRRENTKKINFTDLTGNRFGRLRVINRVYPNRNGSAVWLCVCDCGGITNVVSQSLNMGLTQSCGCLRNEKSAARSTSKKRADKGKTPSELVAKSIRRMVAYSIALVDGCKSSKTFDMLGYTPLRLKEHIERQFLPDMSWDNRNEWHIDHIIPVSTAKCVEDIISLNQLSNLRPLWKVDNLKKYNKREFLI